MEINMDLLVLLIACVGIVMVVGSLKNSLNNVLQFHHDEQAEEAAEKLAEQTAQEPSYTSILFTDKCPTDLHVTKRIEDMQKDRI